MSEERDRHLVRLFENFPQSKVTEIMTADFQRAAGAFDVEIVADVVDDFVMGRDQRLDKKFIPTVGVFNGHLEKAHSDKLREKAKQALLPPKYVAPPPPTEEQKFKVRLLQATFHAARERERYDAQRVAPYKLNSRSYRKWAEKEYKIVLRDGWPVYSKTGHQVLTEEAKQKLKNAI
jgi:hypothetical protein